MLYVYNYTEDTGGLLYPRAINQTFVGLYFMEVCLIGLFLLVRDSKNNNPCLPQAIIMIAVMIVTVLFQVLLNQSFGPLYEHLPVTVEDDAVLRDEAFERVQAARTVEKNEFESVAFAVSCEDIELSRVHRAVGNTSDRRHLIHTGATCATTSGDPDKRDGDRRRDVEAQKSMSEALFSGHHDEIEDLRPADRDALVSIAFHHEALRATRPTVWVPQCDLGVSDQEVQRTKDFCNGNVWITNEGAALDSGLRVIYGTNPPDFSEVSLIKL